MRSAGIPIAVMMALLGAVAGCGSQPMAHRAGAGRPVHSQAVTSTLRQTVAGRLVRAGGPAPGSPVALPGRVEAHSLAGRRFIARAGKDGWFRLSLPPGSYRLTGRSPQVWAERHQMPCAAERRLRVTAGKPPRAVDVICQIR